VNPNDVTDQILSAWDEEEPAEEVTEEPTDEATEDVVETPEEETETPEEGEEEAPEEETEEEGEEDEAGEAETEEEVEEPEGFQSDDPEVQAFINSYQGDLNLALKGAAELRRVLNRQGQEKNSLARQVQELEAELERRASLESSGHLLTAEQQQWVESAVEGDPRSYVRAAVEAGEFDLARAVCEAWSEASPYEAARLAQSVDQLEQRQVQLMSSSQPEMEVDHRALMGILVEHFPEMPAYEERMVSTLAALGENHPLAQDARSNDPETAARGIIGVYEIARASSASVSKTREKVRVERQQAADEARLNGVVSAGQASPSPEQTPRPVRITPGLTLEQLDEAWAAESPRQDS
jgi:hypothetical protein